MNARVEEIGKHGGYWAMAREEFWTKVGGEEKTASVACRYRQEAVIAGVREEG